MIDRDDRDRMGIFAKPQEALGDHPGRKVGREIDDRPGAKLGQRQRRGREIGAELGIESVLALKQKGERALWDIRPEPALQERRPVKADGHGGAEHTLGRRLAHAMARVQHPVDGGDADPGGTGKIGDGRTAQTKGSTA